MKAIWIACMLGLASSLAGAQAPREPISPALTEHFRKAIINWDRGASATPGLSSTTSSVMAEMDFMKVRQQLRDVGTGAAPLAPFVAGLLPTTPKNQYTLAFILYDMVPVPTDAEMGAVIQAAKGASGPEQLVALARLGRASTSPAFEVVRLSAQSQDPLTRLVASVGLGFGGKGFPELAALAAAPNLKDSEKYVRSAAINSLRLLGPGAQPAAPQVVEYLRTRDNVYQATAVLKSLPLSYSREAKAELEAILADPRLNALQKQDAADLLVRIETTR